MRGLSVLPFLLALAPTYGADNPTVDEITRYLPGEAAGWRLADGPILYDIKTVYDYMDGAIDAYRRYAFVQLFVGHYGHAESRIVVEIYDMTRPQEAYGFSTTDFTGTPVDVERGGIYDYGAVRFWRGRYFVKVYDDAGGDANRDQVIQIARAIADRLPDEGTLPILVQRVRDWPLAAKNIRYFHVGENLNDFFYISTENVLHLSDNCDAVMADCTVSAKPIKVTLIQYADKQTRSQAIADFRKAVFTKKATTAKDGLIYEKMDKTKYWALKAIDGSNKEIRLALFFDSASPDQCRKALTAIAPAERTAPKG